MKRLILGAFLELAPGPCTPGGTHWRTMMWVYKCCARHIIFHTTYTRPTSVKFSSFEGKVALQTAPFDQGVKRA